MALGSDSENLPVITRVGALTEWCGTVYWDVAMACFTPSKDSVTCCSEGHVPTANSPRADRERMCTLSKLARFQGS